MTDRPPPADISGAVEAVLLVAEEPISEVALAQILAVPLRVVADCLAELAAFYAETGRGFELRRVGDGWRYYTRAEHAAAVSTFLGEGRSGGLSAAALETLAVVAYQQPISRGRISAIRGVSVDAVVRTLLTRGLLAEAGHDPESGAALLQTTSYFCERMGLTSLAELPPLAPYLPETAAEIDELEAEFSQLAVGPRGQRHRNGPRDDVEGDGAGQASAASERLGG